MCRWFDSAPGHQKKSFLINRLGIDTEKSGPSKGRFFCFLTRFLTLASAIVVEAAACDCAPLRLSAVLAVLSGPRRTGRAARLKVLADLKESLHGAKQMG